MLNVDEAVHLVYILFRDLLHTLQFPLDAVVVGLSSHKPFNLSNLSHNHTVFLRQRVGKVASFSLDAGMFSFEGVELAHQILIVLCGFLLLLHHLSIGGTLRKIQDGKQYRRGEKDTSQDGPQPRMVVNKIFVHIFVG